MLRLKRDFYGKFENDVIGETHTKKNCENIRFDELLVDVCNATQTGLAFEDKPYDDKTFL